MKLDRRGTKNLEKLISVPPRQLERLEYARRNILNHVLVHLRLEFDISDLRFGIWDFFLYVCK